MYREVDFLLGSKYRKNFDIAVYFREKKDYLKLFRKQNVKKNRRFVNSKFVKACDELLPSWRNNEQLSAFPDPPGTIPTGMSQMSSQSSR